jgi:hypothetical protein
MQKRDSAAETIGGFVKNYGPFRLHKALRPDGRELPETYAICIQADPATKVVIGRISVQNSGVSELMNDLNEWMRVQRAQIEMEENRLVGKDPQLVALWEARLQLVKGALEELSRELGHSPHAVPPNGAPQSD